MTVPLEGGEWSAARPGRTLPPGKTRYPFYRRLVGPQVRSGRAENLVPTEIRSRTVQPLVSRYTDWEHNVYCYIHSKYHPLIPLWISKNVCLEVGRDLKNVVFFYMQDLWFFFKWSFTTKHTQNRSSEATMYTVTWCKVPHSVLLECYAMYLGEYFPTFRRIIMPSTSGST